MIFGLVIFASVISIILLTLSQFIYITLEIDQRFSVTLDIIFLSVVFTRTKSKKKKKKEKPKNSTKPLISLPSFLERCEISVDRFIIPTLPYPLVYPIVFGFSSVAVSVFFSYLLNNVGSLTLPDAFLKGGEEDRLQIDITARILLLDFLLLVIKSKKKRKVKSIVGIKNE